MEAKKGKTLALIIDAKPDLERLEQAIKNNCYSSIEVISLASLLPDDMAGVNKVLQKATESLGYRPNVAKEIDAEFEKVSNTIVAWSANLGSSKIDGKSIIDHLQVGDTSLSSWWLSLLSEKNIMKDSTFFHLAQYHFLKKMVKYSPADEIILFLKNRSLRHCIQNFLTDNGLARYSVYKIKANKSIIDTIKSSTGFPGLVKELFHGIWLVIELLGRHIISPAKKVFGNEPEILFIDYFPAYNSELAKQGLFDSNFFPKIKQTILNDSHRCAHLLRFSGINNTPFTEALRQVKQFSKEKDSLAVFESYYSIVMFLKTLILSIRVVIKSITLLKMIKKVDVHLRDPFDRNCECLFDKLWNRSFFGYLLFLEVAHYLIFQHFFQIQNSLKTCVYPAEMQGWEKALNAAIRDSRPRLRTVAFQHSAVSKRYLFYFYHPSELTNVGKYSLPQPHVFAVNGKSMWSLFKKCGYSNLVTVEALRSLYLDDVLSSGPKKSQSEEFNFLFAGSYHEVETTLMFFWLIEALSRLPEDTRLKCNLKSHPSFPLKALLLTSNIPDSIRSRVTLLEGTISEALDGANAVFIPSSSVAIEALAYGARVLIPIFPDVPFMNPLGDYKERYQLIESSNDLFSVIMGYLNEQQNSNFNHLKTDNDNKNFVREFWEINPELPLWKDLLLDKISQ